MFGVCPRVSNLWLESLLFAISMAFSMWRWIPVPNRWKICRGLRTGYRTVQSIQRPWTSVSSMPNEKHLPTMVCNELRVRWGILRSDQRATDAYCVGGKRAHCGGHRGLWRLYGLQQRYIPSYGNQRYHKPLEQMGSLSSKIDFELKLCRVSQKVCAISYVSSYKVAK